MDIGVDTVVTKDTPTTGSNESNLSDESFEIYVQIDLLDKSKYEKDSKAKCKVTDDSLRNQLRDLLDSNTIFTLNPFRDFALAKEYVDNIPSDKSNANENIPIAIAKPVGGKRSRKRTNGKRVNKHSRKYK